MVPKSWLLTSSVLMEKKTTSSFAEMWRGALHKLLRSLLHHRVSLQTAVKMLYQATCLINFHYKSRLHYCQVVTFFRLHLSKESGKRNTYLRTIARISLVADTLWFSRKALWNTGDLLVHFKMSDHRHHLPDCLVSPGQVTSVNIQQAPAFGCLSGACLAAGLS